MAKVFNATVCFYTVKSFFPTPYPQLTPDVEFSAGNGRVQFFSTMKALSAAVPANSAAYWAGNAFFSRDDRPKTLAVGRVFTEPTAAELTGGTT